MTFDDMQTIEASVAGLVPQGMQRPPVMRALTYDRVEIDLSRWDDILPRIALLDKLRRELVRIGHPEWEAWAPSKGASMLYVSEREEP